MRHDGPKNLFASLANKVCNDVEVEPYLEAFTGGVLKYKTANKSDEARSDVRIRGFWSKIGRMHFSSLGYFISILLTPNPRPTV